MKKQTHYLVTLLLLLALAACSDGSGNGSVGAPGLDLQFTAAPIDLGGTDARYAADVRYGDAERNLFDVYLPDSDEPTPLVLYFHGGGYVTGDKSDYLDADVRQFLQMGIAFATVNYTFIEIEPPYDDEGVLKPLTDSARALQFMRYHHRSLNIDPERVASYGVSAGASTSLWLGTHDDIADPANPDPVLRESSRIRAAGALYTQATLNFPKWEEILAPVVEPLRPVLGGTSILEIATALGAQGLLFGASAVDNIEELLSEEQAVYFDNIDALSQMDAGDAPVYVFNDDTIFADDFLNLFLHHALHGIAVRDRALEVGLEHVVYTNSASPAFVIEDPSGERHVSFLSRHIR